MVVPFCARIVSDNRDLVLWNSGLQVSAHSIMRLDIDDKRMIECDGNSLGKYGWGVVDYVFYC